MSDIDPDRVRDALVEIRKFNEPRAYFVHQRDVDLFRDLAAFVEPLIPRFKEMTFAQWATFTADGEIWSSALSEAAAHEEVRQNPKLVAVRLTGTAKVKVNP